VRSRGGREHEQESDQDREGEDSTLGGPQAASVTAAV
jgi:hypothetical protein